ncbi:ATP-binding cassette domain-containing protein [Dolosigranulum pigrum]|uniref:ATP-binding cassette domain-containing protein n=1 Tax=Dolosigranulum pigrum TaxID=29394 RepID=UPI001AD86544|nr:ATP-binding cassette domain-containing protein [Dolosigranulum pigrum]
MKPLVELNQISFGFERTTILDDVSLAIEPGQTVLLCGESGSGKSTLMKLINGYYPDNGGDLLSGTMRIQEQDMLPLNVVERTHYVRSIFQNARLSFSMRNLREELVFCLENVKTDPDKIDEIIVRHTERFQLDYLLD